MTKVTEFNGDILDLIILSALGHGWIFGGGDLADDKNGISDLVRNVSDSRNLRALNVSAISVTLSPMLPEPIPAEGL